MSNASGHERKGVRFVDRLSEMLGERRLILVSNRGPVEHQSSPDGTLKPRRGSGGVVTALSPLINYLDFTWIASAMGEGDRRVAQQSDGNGIRSLLPGQKLFLRYVVTPRRVYHKFYNVFCNPLLWFLQHYMWSSPYTPNVDDSVYDAWDTGYIPVNKAFAAAIIKEAGDNATPPVVMLHDYHLYLTAGMIRDNIPGALIQHFLHIPWPDPSYWQMLPAFMRTAICQSLCASDIVGLQTPRDVRSFLQSCELFLDNVEIDHVECTVQFNGRRTIVKSYPISIDPEELRAIADSPRTLEYERNLRENISEKTIVRVDRVEPSKNIVRGFKAYKLLLERNPELRGRVRFLAFLVPSRTHIRQYQRYLEEVEALISEINDAFGDNAWQPITAFYENNYTQALAGMKLYDVLLVNSVIDGMNLVAKEGPIVNTNDGILVLSETAGAHAQLRNGVISVSPADIEGTTQAMYQALTTSDEDKAKLAHILVKNIEGEDIMYWMESQINDIMALQT